ncbi:hypothetical protein Agub_g6318 [Astrephomene gubernaculifera]|uniref:Uncharacterized protein n=1 Tax=Astrephomene gubernaculifera TaxID=47775 RepID=A0AAD3DQS9_9CHLO|nr:hypothetical protein Agub_g6318 [Astrephomene gubernaculifera]
MAAGAAAGGASSGSGGSGVLMPNGAMSCKLRNFYTSSPACLVTPEGALALPQAYSVAAAAATAVTAAAAGSGGGGTGGAGGPSPAAAAAPVSNNKCNSAVSHATNSSRGNSAAHPNGNSVSADGSSSNSSSSSNGTNSNSGGEAASLSHAETAGEVHHHHQHQHHLHQQQQQASLLCASSPTAGPLLCRRPATAAPAVAAAAPAAAAAAAAVAAAAAAVAAAAVTEGRQSYSGGGVASASGRVSETGGSSSVAIRSPVRIRSSEPVGFADAVTAARMNVAIMADELMQRQAEQRQHARMLRERSLHLHRRPSTEAARMVYQRSFGAFLAARSGETAAAAAVVGPGDSGPGD